MNKTLLWDVPVINEDTKNLAEEVKRQNLHLLEGSHYYWPHHQIFYFGTIEGMRGWQKQVGVNINIVDWCDFSKLSCTSYYAKWGDLLLARDYGFYQLAELRRLKTELWRRYQDENGYCYVRPDSNDKTFGGGIFRQGYFEPWLLETPPEKLTDDLLCLIGRPSRIEAEYRLWLVDKKVVASSLYVQNDRICYSSATPVGAVVLAERAAAIWSPHPAFVIDVAMVNGQFYIIECGSIHTCGVYAADLSSLVKSLNDYLI